MAKAPLTSDYTIRHVPKLARITFRIFIREGDFTGSFIMDINANLYGASVLAEASQTVKKLDFSPDMQIPENEKHLMVYDSEEEPELAGKVKAFRMYKDNGEELRLYTSDGVIAYRHPIVGIIQIIYQEVE